MSENARQSGVKWKNLPRKRVTRGPCEGFLSFGREVESPGDTRYWAIGTP